MSLGKDLASIRHGLGISLEEIQSYIKIPVQTLKSIESDAIFSDEGQNKTYTRSFVRSYAKALKIADALIVEALDSVEAELYVPGSLIEKMDSGIAQPLIKPETLDDSADIETDNRIKLKKPAIQEAPKSVPPTVENVNWADLGKRFDPEESGSKFWMAAAIVAVIIIIAVLIFIFRAQIFGWFSADDTALAPPTKPAVEAPILALPIDTVTTHSPESSTNDDDSPSITTQITPAVQNPANLPTTRLSELYSPTLGDTLKVIVYAAYDKLEPVRVTSDFNWRTNPFWMEQGQAYNFSFQDTLLVRGQYSRMLLLFNGHIIENAANQYYSGEFDSIMLTRTDLNLPEYLVQPGAVFPLAVGAPDSIISPITY